MTDLVAFRVYRTEELIIDGEQVTVRFAKQTDADNYALFANYEAIHRRVQCFYSVAAAEVIAKASGCDLMREVRAVLKSPGLG